MIRREFLSRLATAAAGLAVAGKTGSTLSAAPKPGAPRRPRPDFPQTEITPKALALHKKAVIIDGHNDSLIEHWARKESYDLGRDWPSYQADLRRMKAGGLTAMNSMVGGANLVQGLDIWAGMYENVDKHPGGLSDPGRTRRHPPRQGRGQSRADRPARGLPAPQQ